MAQDPGRMTTAVLLSLLALLAPLLSLSSHPLTSFCPGGCDCSDPRHLVCTNRGLRAVPMLAHPPAKGEEEAEPQKEVLIFSLGGNFISNISSLDFSGLSSLLRLNLQYNQIQNIQPGAFQQVAKLEELYLGHNLLSALPTGTLGPLRKLRVLDGNNNLFSRIRPGTFSQGLQGLVRLRLDGNSIRVLQDQDLQGLTGLHHLHLDHNGLQHIHRRAFSGLVRLRLLSLEHNQLTTLSYPLTFAPLGALTSLLLSHNLLQQVSSRVFLRLGSLTTLSLSSNRISRLEAGALLGLSRLRQLLLDSNQLQVVPAGALDSLVHLEELDLSRNHISSVAPRAFARLGHLKVLRLQENLLSSLSGEVFALNPQLHTLDLRGNNWTCDCQLGGLKAWMFAVHDQGRLLRGSSLQCHHPEELRGKYLEDIESSELLHLPERPHLCRSRGGSERSRESVGEAEGESRQMEVREEEQGLQNGDRQKGEEIWSREGQKEVGEEGWKNEALGEENQVRGLQEGSQEEVEVKEEVEEEDIWRREGQREGEERAGLQGDEGGVEISTTKKPQKKKQQRESLRPRSQPAGEANPTESSNGRQRSKVAAEAGSWSESSTNDSFPPSSTSHLLLRGAPPPPLPVVSDPCDFNLHFIANVSVGHVTSTAATIHWTCREHRRFTPGPEPGPDQGPGPEEVHFRILFDRFGATDRFHRYVYTAGSARSVTLRELLSSTTYMVCVEGVVRRSFCQVAPRDHCAGLVTLPAGVMLTFDLQLATLAAANMALLLLLVGGACLGRSLRRKLQQRRRRRRGRSAAHVYATSRPFRHAAEFSYRAPLRPEEQEGDLIQFPCDRFLEGGAGAASGGGGTGGGAYRDGSLTHFSD